MHNHAEKYADKIPSLDQLDIKELESAVLKQDQLECGVVHRFGPGIYMREVTMPAGAFVIGHEHTHEHMNVFLKGSMTILCDGVVSEIKAPMTFVAKPGRKIAQIHEECVFVNIFPNVENEQDIEVLENKFLKKSAEFLLSEETRNAILIGNRKWDNKDYLEAMNEVGVSGNIIISDWDPLPFSGYKIKIGGSRIHGKGIFATSEIEYGELIGPVKKEKFTVLGKYLNHSRYPNAKLIRRENGHTDLLAIDKIYGCRGGFDGDEITIDYREAYGPEGVLCQR